MFSFHRRFAFAQIGISLEDFFIYLFAHIYPSPTPQKHTNFIHAQDFAIKCARVSLPSANVKHDYRFCRIVISNERLVSVCLYVHGYWARCSYNPGNIWKSSLG